MAVKTEQVEKNLVKLTFEVSYDVFEKAMNDVYLKNRSKYSIPGYRKGKVPRTILEKFYSPAIFYDDAINAVLPDAYEAAVKESAVEPAARPEIDIDGEITKGSPIVFTALITVKPEVTLGDYKGVEVEEVPATVSAAEVDAKIEKERQNNARVTTVEDRGIKLGDTAVIDFDGSVDGVHFEGGKGENYDLEIGSNTFIPGFEDQLIGAKTDDDVKVNVTFPAEYHAKDLAGKEAVFECKIKEIKEKQLPDLDDEFASEVSDFDTLKEYKKSVKEQLQKEADEKAKTALENSVIEKVSDNATVEIPEAMLNDAVDRNYNDFAQRLQYQGMNIDMYMQYTGSNEEQMKAQMRPDAEKQLKASLVLEAIVKAEGIEIGDGEVELELADMAKKYGMEVDKLKELMNDAELDNVRKDMAMKKAIDLIVKAAKTTEAKPAKKTAAKKTTKKADDAEADEKPAPKKRAPRKKKEDAE